MDYTPNIDAQGMRRPMGPVDQPNWNGGPKLIHNPQVMNNQTVGQPNLANAMANQRKDCNFRAGYCACRNTNGWQYLSVYDRGLQEGYC